MGKDLTISSEIVRDQHILIVDDNEANRLLISKILESSGYFHQSCANGKEALELIKIDQPELVLLDVMMPIMDGFSCCEEIRKLYSKDELPVIMVTAKAEAEDTAQGLQVGANDYVTKPIQRKSLVARIENHLAISRAYKKIESQRRSLKKALRIQNALGNLLPDAVAVSDSERKLLYANSRFLEACDYSLPDRLEDAWGILHGGLLRESHLEWDEIIKNDPEQELNREVEVQDARLRTLNYHVLSRPVTLDQGMNLRVWIWKDMTELRQLQRRINQQVKLDTVGLFAKGVAHNFNNILGGIRGATDILAKSADKEPRIGKCVELLKKSVANGSKLTRKLSSIAPDEEQSTSLDYSDTAAIMKEIVEELNQGRESQVQLEVTPVDTEVLELEMNLTKFKEVLKNITSNSFDALEDNAGVIRVTGKRSEQDDFVEIVIQDDGMGMDSEAYARIFEPFFSSKNLDKRNGVSYSGNGLGMWAVYNLMRASGGEVEVRSKPGEGTSVTLRLPVPAEKSENV